MHDYRFQQNVPYEPDAAIDDPADWRPPFVDGEEVEMHVQLDGTWHRDRIGKVDRTACDKTYRFSTIPSSHRRRAVLEGVLCSVCFTAGELADALEALAKARREADGFIGINPRRRR